MPLLRAGGIRVSSFSAAAATKSLNPKFYSSFWPLLSSPNCRQAKQTFTNCHCHVLGMKQYFFSSSTDVDMTMGTAKVVEAGTGTAVDEQQEQEKQDEAVEAGTGTAVDEQQEQDKAVEAGNGTAVDEQQEQEKQDESAGKVLDKHFLSSTAAGGAPRVFSVELNERPNGFKYFELKLLVYGRFTNFPKILVPEDTYPFVRAMDELLANLDTKEEENMPPTRSRLLFSTRSPGLFYDFQLDLAWHNGRFQVDLGTRRNEANPDHVERRMGLRLRDFHWLRHRMGEMLASFDGSQPVDEPPKFPGHWLEMDGRHRSLALPRPRPRVPRQQQQQRQKMESIGGGMDLAKRFLRSTNAKGAPRGLSVELGQGQSGHKFLKFCLFESGRFFDSPKIRILKEAYPFVRAMDELLEELAAKEGQNFPSTGRLLLFSTKLPSEYYDYQMDLQWVNGGFVVKFGSLRTETERKERPNVLFLSVKEFHWLRHEMGQMLTEFDGTQIVDEPPRYPKWLRMDGRPRSALALARPSPNRLVPWLQQSQRQPNADDVNIALLQVQLLSQSRQIEQLQQQISSIAQPVLPDHVPSVLPELAENAIGGREWNEMANVLAQAIQMQMGHVPAGNGQPVPALLASQQQQRKWPDDLSGWNCEEDGEDDDQQGQ